MAAAIWLTTYISFFLQKLITMLRLLFITAWLGMASATLQASQPCQAADGQCINCNENFKNDPTHSECYTEFSIMCADHEYCVAGISHGPGAIGTADDLYVKCYSACSSASQPDHEITTWSSETKTYDFSNVISGSSSFNHMSASNRTTTIKVTSAAASTPALFSVFVAGVFAASELNAPHAFPPAARTHCNANTHSTGTQTNTQTDT